MIFGDKTIREYLSQDEVKAQTKDILSNVRLVRSSMGTANNDQFMLPMLVLQNIALLEEVKAMREIMEKSFGATVVNNVVVEDKKEEVKLGKEKKTATPKK